MPPRIPRSTAGPRPYPREPSPNGLIVAHDLADQNATTWPRFAPQAVEAGYRSILSIQLSTHGGTRAALNLYAAEAHVFDSDARHTAALFGIQAAVLLYGSDEARSLRRAIDSRDLIGQAKGILMERFGVDADSAFQMLVGSSQDTNMKLVDVARWLTAPSEPTAPEPSPSPRRELGD